MSKGPIDHQTPEMRQLRLQETIYPFGVGAIVDIKSESFIGMDTSTWNEKTCRPLPCRPLERELGVLQLREPPTAGDFSRNSDFAIPYRRFPKWRFCQDCSLMSNRVHHQKGASTNGCSRCAGPMVPMRFIAVCASGGHIQDIGWRRWSHFEAANDEQRQCRDYEHLELRTTPGAGESLRSLRVMCRSCGISRHLGSLGRNESLHEEGHMCRGLQPWEPQDTPKDCASELRVIQRGSTSVYQAETTSAIDIPEVASATTKLREQVLHNDMFKGVFGQKEGPLLEYAVPVIAAQTGAPEHMVRRLLTTDPTADSAQLETNLHSGEWAAFDRVLAGDEEVKNPDFDVDRSDYPDEPGVLPALADLVSDVGLVHRLREVRALRGFRRYEQEHFTRVDLGTIDGLKWYPAIEQFGEGIFLRFDEDIMRAWEDEPAVQRRIQHWTDRGANLTNRRLVVSDLRPRYVLLHTLAHLLMRRLEFQSGYSASSLSERVYASCDGPDPQSGLLIYTSSGDAQGTLGGLVRLGEARYFSRLLLGAVEDADRCSNNPVCAESSGQGMNSLNLAACHACSLVSETSCERSNIYLDRKLLVGDDSLPGFFRDVLAEARANIGG
ncbi:DrmB family protein [Kocuria flava]|uniref:DrmB family protein n=1 Tax=Kocuria flava TaxID=446860 RepID=UPI003F1CC029